VAFVLGALLMFRPFEPVSPALPTLRIDPWLLGVVTLGLGGGMFLVIRQVVRARNAPPRTGPQHYLGQVARVHAALNPLGRIWFEGQTWNAELRSGGTLPASAKVRIVGREGLSLIVEPVEEQEAA
jgi:membrane-bound serine protease (ClpP class)